MKINITTKIGRSTLAVQVEGAEEEEAFVRASAITTMPDTCGLCSSTDVELSSNKAQDKYTYIKVRCRQCGATSTMGKYQDKSGVFWKAFEIYNKENK